jgi:GT2 family glycosyltransferase
LSQLPSVAIVILNWNGRNFLEKFLPSVVASTYKNLQIVVADNASADDSVTFIKEHYPQIRLVVNYRNYGFAEGYNKALEQVSADYYVLLNSDVEVKSDWIEPVIELMESDALIAACQPKILSYNNKDMFEYAGAAGGWIDSFGYPFCRGRVFDTCEKDNGQYDNAQQVFWASGAALFVKAEVFQQLNGFDESFFAHQEEIDLCWRMQLAGYKVYVEPQSSVYHVGGGSLPTGSEQKVYLNFRNNLVMMYKNLPGQELYWKIPLRNALDNLAALKNLISGNWGGFKAILRAQLHFYKWILGERSNKWFPKDKKEVVHGVFSGLVIWEYYGKGRKTFKEIVKNKS